MLLYWFNMNTTKYKCYAGLVQKALTKSMIESMEIESRVKIKTIANILSLDDKIELNNKINKNLEEFSTLQEKMVC